MNLAVVFGIALIFFCALSGIIAYGLLKGRALIMYSRDPELRHGNAEETWRVISGLLGPLGLIIVLQICLSAKTNFALCYRMPKELCE